RYLEERGINSALANFLPDYIEYKEQKEYIQWLDNMKNTLIAHEEELIKQYSKNNHHRRRRNSNSSISSDDLAAIHLDLMSSSSSRPLLLSDSSSVASSQSIETPRLLHKITWNK
ncbi:hypothetical protein CU097_000071, partial [Rhizopus azygosporus]